MGNEVKVNVLNAPYGGFPWIDMPQSANTNWYNAHNFYGDLTDIEAAKLDEVRSSHTPTTRPIMPAWRSSATSIRPKRRNWSRNTSAPIKSAQASSAARPHRAAPGEAEKRISKTDPLAPRPALAIGYHMPERNTPEYYAMGLIDQMLIEGDDSRLYQELVQKRGLTDSVNGGINLLGNMFDYNGPMLLVADLRYDPTTARHRAGRPWTRRLRRCARSQSTRSCWIARG